MKWVMWVVGGVGQTDSAKWKKGSGKWARVRVMRSERVETIYIR